VRYFARQIGHVVSRAELLQNVWRVAAGSATRAVDVAIVALRAKVEKDPENPTVITTVRGTAIGSGREHARELRRVFWCAFRFRYGSIVRFRSMSNVHDRLAARSEQSLTST